MQNSLGWCLPVSLHEVGCWFPSGVCSPADQETNNCLDGSECWLLPQLLWGFHKRNLWREEDVSAQIWEKEEGWNSHSKVDSWSKWTRSLLLLGAPEIPPQWQILGWWSAGGCLWQDVAEGHYCCLCWDLGGAEIQTWQGVWRCRYGPGVLWRESLLCSRYPFYYFLVLAAPRSNHSILWGHHLAMHSHDSIACGHHLSSYDKCAVLCGYHSIMWGYCL